jgi:hypothetical protein
LFTFNGELTHFYSTTHHAVDFRAPVGAPVLAVGEGKVVDVVQHNTVSGVHVKNLFMWNSVMLQLDDGVFVEYPFSPSHHRQNVLSSLSSLPSRRPFFTLCRPFSIFLTFTAHTPSICRLFGKHLLPIRRPFAVFLASIYCPYAVHLSPYAVHFHPFAYLFCPYTVSLHAAHTASIRHILLSICHL